MKRSPLDQTDVALNGSTETVLRIGRRLWGRFLLVLLLMAALSSLAYATFHFVVQGQEEVGALINDTGRQRMLSQRIAADTARLVQAGDEARRAELRRGLLASAALMEGNQASFDFTLIPADQQRAAERILMIAPHALEQRLERFLSDVRTLVEIDDAALSPDHPLAVRVIDEATGPLLQGLDALVSVIEAGGASRVVQLKTLAVAWQVLFLGLLLLMALAVFRPLARNTEAAFHRLADMEAFHRSVFNTMADGILILSPDGQAVESSNPAARTIFGIGAADPLPPLAAVIPAAAGLPREELLHWTGRKVDGHRFGDGGGLHLEVSVRAAAQDKLVSVVRDISQRVEAEAHVHSLYEAMEQGPVSVIITDTKGTILYANRKVCEVTGYAREELIGQNPRIFKSGRMLPETYREMWQTIKSGQEWRSEILNRKKSGELFWELEAISPLRDSRGRITRFMAVKEDVTERKHLENAIFKASRRAERANRAKSDFLAGMSHELRTPLNAILGYSELLGMEVDGPLGSPKYRYYVTAIHDSGQHLLTLINNLLDLSKIEAGKMELEESELDLTTVVKEAVRLVQGMAQQRGIRIEERHPHDLPTLYGDPLRLKQVALNLLGNAVKFSHDGGNIVIESAQDATGELCVRIHDRGIGIAEEDIPRVQEPFGQASNPHLSAAGTGLGLPLSRKFMELHGGSLEITSTPDEGTTVCMRLPANRVGRMEEASPETASAPGDNIQS